MGTAIVSRHDFDVERVVTAVDVVLDAHVRNWTWPWSSYGRSCSLAQQNTADEVPEDPHDDPCLVRHDFAFARSDVPTFSALTTR